MSMQTPSLVLETERKEDWFEEEEEYRETDSDSDSYDVDGVDSPLQRLAANALRSVAGFLALVHPDDKKVEKLAAQCMASVQALIRAPCDAKNMQAMVNVGAMASKVPRGKTVAFVADRVRHAAAIALKALSPHLRLTKKQVYHAALLEKLLSHWAGKSRDLTKADIDDITLFAYWSAPTMDACARVQELLTQTDAQYARSCAV